MIKRKEWKIFGTLLFLIIILPNVNSQSIEKIKSFPIKTCLGDGELYIYQGYPYQDINAKFKVNRTELYIFTRADYLKSINISVDGVLTNPVLIIKSLLPFKVNVYKIKTKPGSEIIVDGKGTWNARAIQGFLAQNQENPAYDLKIIKMVYDGKRQNDIFLKKGEYSYVFFDKYTLIGNNQDKRKLNIVINDETNNVIINKTYDTPFPLQSQGVVYDNYIVNNSQEYTIKINTKDSIYWFLLECQKCSDSDNDGVCDEDDQCQDSKPNELIDQNGCDPFQFCEQFYCGPGCYHADFLNNEPNTEFPLDCTTVIIINEGTYQPKCVPLTCTN